ncbi:MAG: type IV toxin-antitoxin system AbiEi family antitoxin domain-containing protein [Nocardioides sp.]|uniref:type IV toxin-antitoxin system AbiEi family antitoxin domain-containing protein n=1 Tax=Nocardioides sp. TaxID=35761 RepID=UPI003266EADD
MSNTAEESSPADEVARILSLQHGVISRAQAIEAGLADHDIRRLVRRRAWVLLLPGVCLNHTGEPTWLQRAWASTLYAGDSALCHDSALRASEGPGKTTRDESVVHVAIDRDRRILSPVAWLVVHRLADFDDKVRRNASPPTVRIEHALLDVAAEAATDFAAVGVLTDAVSARRITADRVLAALQTRSRIPRRAFLTGVLSDIRDGTHSVLEHGYLHRVERAHCLPRASRQLAELTLRGKVYRDAAYEQFGVYVELDGRATHGTAQAHDQDLARDLAAVGEQKLTLRLGWRQVYGDQCSTAAQVAAVLTKRGWTGTFERCPDCP